MTKKMSEIPQRELGDNKKEGGECIVQDCEKIEDQQVDKLNEKEPRPSKSKPNREYRRRKKEPIASDENYFANQ